jgi:uncharacterized iron-regulated protein
MLRAPEKHCMARALLFLALFLAAGGCRAPAWECVEGASGEAVTLAAMADRLAEADVVFLGEQHDSDVGHALQLETTKLLLARRGRLALSLEMLEADCQLELDRYLRGELSEARFLESARLWSNYHEHYRPAVELARREGLPVLAANVPRPLAARVAREGLAPVFPQPMMPFDVRPDPGPYRERFEEAMGNHAGVEVMDRVYAAQVVKDEKMAEAIDYFLEREPRTLVVHWVGKFHSDYRLGTVERLLRRRPGLRVGVVSMRSGSRDPASVEPDERAAADFLWLVRN